MKLNPMHDRVVVRPKANETTTRSGIVIPDNAQEKPSQGTVVAVGPGRTLENGTVLAMTLKAGDHVLYGKYAGQSIKVDGEELTILKEEDVFATVEQ
jgi:chaperonin GroES